MRILDDGPNRITFGIGLFLSIIWIIGFILYIDTQIGWGNVEVLLPSEQGGLLAGLTAPLGFLWLFLAFLKRGTDVERHTEVLQSELRKLSYPLTDAEAKTMRIADALRRQVEVLNDASDSAQEQLTRTGDALESQAQRITGFTRDIDERIAGVGKALRGHVADLEIQLADAGRKLEDQAGSFASQVDAARRAFADPAEEIAALGDKLAAQPAAFAKSAREQGAALIAAFDAAGETSFSCSSKR